MTMLIVLIRSTGIYLIEHSAIHSIYLVGHNRSEERRTSVVTERRARRGLVRRGLCGAVAISSSSVLLVVGKPFQAILWPRRYDEFNHRHLVDCVNRLRCK